MAAIDTVRRVGGTVLLFKGLFGFLLPRQYITANLYVLLPGFENPDDLEPKAWYVETVRAVAAGMIATGIVTLIQSTRTETEPISIPTDDVTAETDESDGDSTA